MITFRYHVITVMAIFISLGIGIVIGGSAGDRWLEQHQRDLMNMLEERYEQELQKSQRFQSQLIELTNEMNEISRQSLTLLSESYRPFLQEKNVLVWSDDPAHVKQLQGILVEMGMNVYGRQEPIRPDVTIYLSGSKPDVSSRLLKLQRIPYSLQEKWELVKQIHHAIKESEWNGEYEDQRNHPGV